MRVRSDASMQSAGSISRPQSVAGGRRVSGMPSPRRTSVAIQPSASWLGGTTIAEEDEGSSSASGAIPVPMEVRLAMQQPVHFSQSVPASAVMQSVTLAAQPHSAQPSPPLGAQQPTSFAQAQNQAVANLAASMFGPTAPAVAPHLHYPNLNFAPSPPQQCPLWAAGLPPHIVPAVAGPSTLGKHVRDSAPNSPAVPLSEATPTTRPPPRKKPRLESSLGHGAPPHVRRMMLTAALFRGPREEDIPEEERSPEKKTLYGTERANDTRFGEFGWGWC